MVSIAAPRRPDLVAAHLGRAGRRVPLLLLDSDIEENPATTARSPTASTAATPSTGCARSSCSASAASARCASTPGSPARPAPEVFHTNEGHAGFLGIERIREFTVAEGGPGSTSTPRWRSSRAGTVFTTHTPVPAGIDRFPRELIEQYFGGESSDARCPARPDPRARRRGLRGRRPQRLQHGRDGLPARPARQRRLPAARPRVARDVQRPVAGLRRGRGPDRLDHQRCARPDLGRPRDLRARRRAGRRRRRRRHRRAVAAGRQDPRRALWELKRALRERLVDDARGGSPSRGASAAPRRPSSAGSTPRSTPTC